MDISRREALHHLTLLVGGAISAPAMGAILSFVTDGACMTSAACQNPSLTYMALTARAADYAARAVTSGELRLG